MRILLIQPNTSTLRGTTCPPLGLMFVAAVVRQAGHEVKIIDRNIDYFPLYKTKRFKPDLVGISSFTGPMILDAIRVSKRIKEIFGDEFPVVWGGIHPSLLPEQTLENPYIDFIVRGEGEHTFLELVEAIEQGKELEGIKGIGYKKNGRIILNEERPFIENLDELPLLPWDIVRAEKYFAIEVVIVTSRGCPHNCAFCYNQKFNKRRWRAWSAERTLTEIAKIEEITSNRRLKFHDDNFTVNKKRFYKIMEGLSSEYTLYLEARAEHIDEEFLSRLDKFRRVWLFIGVESGSKRLLEKMNKGTTHDHIRNAYRLCRAKKNIFTTTSVILGLPTETPKELQMTLELVEELCSDWATYCLYTPYPGNRFYEEIIAGGAFRPPESLMEWANFTPDIGKTDFSKITHSKVDQAFLKKLNRKSWIEVMTNMAKRGDLHKVYRRLIDSTPFLTRTLNLLEEKWHGLL